MLIDDRLDCVLAAREQGIAVDGVHVGQSDIPVEVCRKLLGPDAIVGLSARCEEMLEYVKTADMSLVDYLGIGPLHETETKRDCGRAADGSIITKSFEDLAALHAASPVPIVVGGGVKTADLPQLKATGVDGFFVVSAVCAPMTPTSRPRSSSTPGSRHRHRPSSCSAASYLQERKAHPSLDVHSGMRFPPCGSVGKPHPIPDANSGTPFPKPSRPGNCIPFWTPILGRAFRRSPYLAR